MVDKCRPQHCDICGDKIRRLVDSGPADTDRSGGSVGKSTLLCAKCQDDILNSNRMLSSQRHDLKSISDDKLQEQIEKRLAENKSSSLLAKIQQDIENLNMNRTQTLPGNTAVTVLASEQAAALSMRQPAEVKDEGDDAR